MRDLKLEIGNCIVGVLLVEVSSNGSGRSHSQVPVAPGGCREGEGSAPGELAEASGGGRGFLGGVLQRLRDRARRRISRAVCEHAKQA